eukprot:1161803-Pelagomonas_calceolata.AAC.18
MFPVEVTRMTWAVWTAAGRQGAVLGNVLRCDAGQRVKGPRNIELSAMKLLSHCWQRCSCQFVALKALSLKRDHCQPPPSFPAHRQTHIWKDRRTTHILEQSVN